MWSDETENEEYEGCHVCGSCGELRFTWLEEADDEVWLCEEHWIREARDVGSTAWFEYHCHQGHDSSDAAIWYRSRQQVTITARERGEEQAWWVYTVEFADGLEWHVTEDELFDTPGDFDEGDWAPPSVTDIEAHDPSYAKWLRAHPELRA